MTGSMSNGSDISKNLFARKRRSAGRAIFGAYREHTIYKVPPHWTTGLPVGRDQLLHVPTSDSATRNARAWAR